MKTNWQNYIHSDPEILVGKPVVKGTRLGVDFILGLFANGWTDGQVLESYPTLTPICVNLTRGGARRETW